MALNIHTDINVKGNLALTSFNNIAHFSQSSPPTIRNDGSGLVAGDRFYSTSNYQKWIWNGTYWLSEEPLIFTNGSALTVSGTLTSNYTHLPKYTGVLVEEVRLIYSAASLQDSTNYWNIGFHFATDDGTTNGSTSTTNLGNSQTDSLTTTNYKTFSPNFYKASISSTTRITQFRLQLVKNASAGNLDRLYFCVRLREVL